MPEAAQIVDPVLLIRVPQAFRRGMSHLALYEATRGVWRIGPRRDSARYALAIYRGVVEEVFEIHHWQPALTAHYATRTLDQTLANGRWEFVGAVAPYAIRQRYRGKSVASYFTRGAQNPITYANVPR